VEKAVKDKAKAALKARDEAEKVNKGLMQQRLNAEAAEKAKVDAKLKLEAE